MSDILENLDQAWDEDFKANLMHYCDLAAQEIRKLRQQNAASTAEVQRLEKDLDGMGEMLHTAEAQARHWKAAHDDMKGLAKIAIVR